MGKPSKSINDKLKLLKDIATGKQPLSKIGRPQWIVVHVRGEAGKDVRTYEIDRKEYTQQEYDTWKEGIDESTTILHFIEILDYSGNMNGNAPLEENPSMVPEEVKVVQLPEDTR